MSHPSSTASFHNPLEGRPKPLERAGLFLLNPEVYLKLAGISPQAVFAEQGLGALFRRLKRLQQGHASQNIVLKALTELLQRLNPPFRADFDNALAGNAVTLKHLERMGQFESVYLGMGLEPAMRKRRHWYLLVMERTNDDVLKLVKNGDIAGAAQLTADHPLLGQLLWPEALDRFKNSSSELGLLPLSTALTLETHLGFLAAWDLDVSDQAAREDSSFACLFPSGKQPGRNPTSLYYDELQRRLGATSIGNVLKTSAGSQSGLEQSTLNRWSAGTHSPDVESLKRLLEAYGLRSDDEVLWAQLGCTRHLQLLGYLGQRFSRAAIVSSTPDALWPWPQYPFGYPNFEAWTAARYPHWLAILRNQGDALRAMAES